MGSNLRSVNTVR